MGSRGLTSSPASYPPPPPPPRPLPNPQVTLPSTPPPPLSPSVAVPPSAAVWSMPLCRVLWFLFSINYFRKTLHAWVGQIVTFFVYRPPSRPLGSLTPTQPGRVTNPTQGHPGPPWEAPQAECRSLRREPKPPA